MSAFDDLVDQVSDLSDSFDDYSSENDDNISDIQDNLSNFGDSIDQLNTTAGTLTFPLDPNTVDLIKSLFITGTVVLGSGATTINDPRISTNSNVALTNVRNGGTIGIPSCSLSNGQMTIGSSSSLDTSTISYVIFFSI